MLMLSVLPKKRSDKGPKSAFKPLRDVKSAAEIATPNAAHNDLTPEGVPSDYGENNARIFSAVDDDTRVIPAVEFRNVNFAYGDQIVLNDIGFKVMRGELLVVLSASGGGKSTILNWRSV